MYKEWKGLDTTDVIGVIAGFGTIIIGKSNLYLPRITIYYLGTLELKTFGQIKEQNQGLGQLPVCLNHNES